MNKDILDIDDVLERVQGDWELLLELFTIFEDDYREKKILLEEAIKDAEFEQIKNLSHSMKGASGNISAKTMHSSCAKIEHLAEAGDIQGVRAQTGFLDQQFKDLQGCMNELRQKHGKS